MLRRMAEYCLRASKVRARSAAFAAFGVVVVDVHRLSAVDPLRKFEFQLKFGAIGAVVARPLCMRKVGVSITPWSMRNLLLWSRIILAG